MSPELYSLVILKYASQSHPLQVGRIIDVVSTGVNYRPYNGPLLMYRVQWSFSPYQTTYHSPDDLLVIGSSISH